MILFSAYIFVTDHGETKPKPRNLKSTDPNPHANGEPRCLFRATNGKKKYSTVVGCRSSEFHPGSAIRSNF